MKNRNIYIDIIVNNSMKAIKNLGYTAAFAASMLFPKYSVANDVMSEPKPASKLELALEDSTQSSKKDKEVYYAFALDWEDKNGNGKAEESEVVGRQENFRKGVYSINENPCYLKKSSRANVAYIVKKDGKIIVNETIKNKDRSTIKIDLPNTGAGKYKISFGEVVVHYEVK